MKTLAVHLHLYYVEQIDEVLTKLANLQDVDYDLYVTMTKEDADVWSKIKRFNPQSQIWLVSNRGYDIGPFVEFLHRINLDDYKYILKVHTKSKYSKNYTHLNNMRFDNALWGRVLWDALLATPKRVLHDLKLLEDAQTGMLSSSYCINKEKRNYNKLLLQINQKLNDMNLDKTNEPEFVAGSMFYARADLLKPLLSLQLNDFAITDGAIKEGTLAHVMERVMGAMIASQGYKISGVSDWYPRLLCWKTAFKRFVYQRKVTANNKLLIKVLKLPIYSKKI